MRGRRATLHAVIVAPHCAAKILDGRKTIESRLTLTRRSPFGMVAAGDRVLFKARGGPYVVAARVARVETFEGLTPGGVAAIRRAHNGGICGEAAYWARKAGAKYATLVWLSDVRAIEEGPELGSLARHAWVCFAAGGGANVNARAGARARPLTTG